MSQLFDLVIAIWPGGTIDLSSEGAPTLEVALNPDRCRNHAERNVTQSADRGGWEILGIGASHKICMNCQAAIKQNSPAAIMVPIGGSLRCGDSGQ